MPDAPESLTIAPSHHIQETTLSNITVVERHADGRIKRAFVNSEVVVSTSWGDLVPQYSGDSDGESRRQRLPAVRLDNEGRLESLALESMHELKTPLGTLPAELVTFYEDGSLKRIFPLNGKLSAYWSWQDEYGFAPEIQLPLPESVLPADNKSQSARFINILLNPAGHLRSATLWPGETLDIVTPQGPAKARVGVSFYEHGQLASLEPHALFTAQTPIGELRAYDPDPEAVSGDVNSLGFAQDGSIQRVSTMQDIITVETTTGGIFRFAPREVDDLCSSSIETAATAEIDDSEGIQETPEPLTVWFDEGTVYIAHGRLGASGTLPKPKGVFSLKNDIFRVEPIRRAPLLSPIQRSCA